LNVDTEGAIACSYQRGAFQDIIALSTGATEFTVADFRIRGEFVWLRMEGTVMRHAFAVRTSTLYLGTRDLLEDSLCAQFAE
jgi:hypothetical protein